MPLLQLTYASRPFGYDGAMLQGVLMDARRCNARDGVTGALICRDDLFLQMLEGAAAAVEATYARIVRDDRQIEVRPLTRSTIPDDGRLFAAWAMRDDPAQSWVWSREQVHDGAPERASQDTMMAIYARLAAEPAA